MAQAFYKIELDQATWPLLSENQTRTSIHSSSGRLSLKEEAKPGIAYCHNLMPIKEGYDTVGYSTVINPILGFSDANSLTDTKRIYSQQGNQHEIAWDLNGRSYTLKKSTLTWQQLPLTSPPTTSPTFTANNVTIATVNGISYIFFRDRGCFTYDENAIELVHVPLTGLDILELMGVVAAGGYLVAYTKKAIAWSSTLDPTDFVPSPVTGAGGGDVQDIEGDILFAVANSMGILVFTSNNVVAATITGNAQYPFKFRKVDEAKGGITLLKVAHGANSAIMFSYTRAGLQSITSQSANTILPEVTDYLAGRRFEDFDEETKQFSITDLPQEIGMNKRIKYLGSRYLIISYGIEAYTHALVYDTSLERLGKLKIEHTDVLEYSDNRQREVAKEFIGFLLRDGSIKVVEWDAADVSRGVMMLARIQAFSTRMTTMLGVELENVGNSEPDYEVFDYVSLDGRTTDRIVPGYLMYEADNIREHSFCEVGKIHSLLFMGSFKAVTAQIRYTVHGKR